MNPELSVVIPAHNPREDYMFQVLDALRQQTLPKDRWELVVVDNKSTKPLKERIDLAWHPASEVVLEERLGLTHARVAGFRRTRGNIVVLVDDDNELAPDYLEQVVRISAELPFVAVWGGAIQPRYEDSTFALPRSLWSLLTLRQVETDLWSNDPAHHVSTPWGAGLCLRREVANQYVAELMENPRRFDLDLQGSVLLYGGDTDISYSACRIGYAKGVFRALNLTHLIPKTRCNEAYLCRVAYGRGYSEILHHLSLNGRLPDENAGFSQWARRRFRQFFLPSLERSVDRAHMRGRADAYRKLLKPA